MKLRTLSASLLLASTLGCASMDAPGPATTVGGLGGAAAGGLVAAVVSRGDPAAITAGVLLGGMLGGATGTVLDRQSQYAQTEAMRRAYGQRLPVPWQTASAHGTVTPGEMVLRANGVGCQRATVTAVHEGKVYSNEVCLKAGAKPGEVTVEPWGDGR